MLEIVPSGDWAFVAANWESLLAGTVVTILLTITSLSLGFLAGFPAGAIEVYDSGPLGSAVGTLGVLLRGTPIVVLVVLFHLIRGGGPTLKESFENRRFS